MAWYEHDPHPIIIAFLAGALIPIIILGTVMKARVGALQKGALKRGYATWETTEDGEAAFQWKEEKDGG